MLRNPTAEVAPPPNRFRHLLRLGTAAFGDPQRAQAWLVTDHEAWGCRPLRHAQTLAGRIEVEGMLGALITARAARSRRAP